MTILAYARVISDAHGHYRMDQSIVPNIRLNSWLRVEAGIRFGERTQRFNSYYHYKLELQTKSFWNTIRLAARISDNVIRYPSPSYRKTNELVLAEATFRVTPLIHFIGAGGYVWSAQQNNNTEALPTRQGKLHDYGIYKATVRFLLPKGFLETSFGSYDTFNPYEPDRPFFQEGFEYRLSKRCTSYNYFRYEYHNTVFTPYNYFLGLGVKLHL
jgi:hypothetical protein